jgi:hypothetical protein
LVTLVARRGDVGFAAEVRVDDAGVGAAGARVAGAAAGARRARGRALRGLHDDLAEGRRPRDCWHLGCGGGWPCGGVVRGGFVLSGAEALVSRDGCA